MTLRSRVALAAFGAIAVTVLLALVLTDLALRDELALFSIIAVFGGLAAAILAAAVVAPVERERADVRSDARDELRASVRRFGEALRSTTVEVEGEADPDLGPLLAVVLETALAAAGAHSGAVYIYDRAHARLDPVIARGCDASVPLMVEDGLVGWVAAHRTSMRLPSRTADAPELSRNEPKTPAAVAVPLESPGGLLGVLAVYGDEFDEDDLEALAALGRQASVGADNVLLHHQARRLSVTDALTGIANFRAFSQRLGTEFERAVRFDRPLSLVIVDLDLFKLINDEYGHQRGDAVLAELAARMSACTRGSIDLVARYGGEEFALLLPETDPEGARAVAEKVRAAAAETPFAGGEQHLHITVSAGYATYPHHAADADTLIQAADIALYEAKRAGRNRVCGAIAGVRDHATRPSDPGP